MKYSNIVEVGDTLSVLALASFLILLLAGGVLPAIFFLLFAFTSVLWILVFRL